MFGVHPAPTSAIQLTMTGIQYPVTESTWPPTGAETVPFHHEQFLMAELYATSIARLKEMGVDAQEGMASFLQRRTATFNGR